MKEMYIKSLQMIKELNIQTEKEYIALVKNNLILRLPSLKYITHADNFIEIVKLAKEVA